MDVRRVTCQVRRDLKGDIPEALLRLEAVRAAVARTVGKVTADLESSQEERSVLELLGREPVARGAPLREQLATRIVVKNGFVERFPGAAEPPSGGFIVEELTLDEDTLYIRALAPTEECRAVLDRIATILESHGVPSSTLGRYDEAHATETSGALDGPIESLFSDAFLGLVRADLPNISRRNEKTQVVVHPYLIRLKIHRWQHDATRPDAARPDTWNVELMHETFDDHDNKVYKFYSRFEYVKHVELLRHLNSCLVGG